MSDTFGSKKGRGTEVECSCGQKVIMHEGFHNAVRCSNCGANMALVQYEEEDIPTTGVKHDELCANCSQELDRPERHGILCSKCERDLEHSSRLTGVKHDATKPRHSLLPHSIDDIIAVLEYGAAKYGERNWELGMEWSRPWNAALRHLWAWWRGEDCDKESKLPHLAHAAVNCMFLLDYAKRGLGRDDRP